MNEPTTASGVEYVMVRREPTEQQFAAMSDALHHDVSVPRARWPHFIAAFAAPQPAPSAVAGEDDIERTAKAMWDFQYRKCDPEVWDWNGPHELEDPRPHYREWARAVIAAFSASPSAPTQGQEGDSLADAYNLVWDIYMNILRREDSEVRDTLHKALRIIGPILQGDRMIATPPAPDGGEAVAIWRLLEVGDLIERGDEWWDDFTHGWRTTNDQGLRVLSTKPYRRRALAVIPNPSAPKAGDAEKAK